MRWLALLLVACSGQTAHDAPCDDWEARDVPNSYETCLMWTPGGETLRARPVGTEGCGATCLLLAPGEDYTALAEPGTSPSTLGSLKPVDCSAECPAEP